MHLFEIWETLKRKFGSDEENTLTALKISENQRKTFGNIANDLPIRQGRHRGRHSGQLRDATKEELEKARKIAQLMIENYFAYLESMPNTNAV